MRMLVRRVALMPLTLLGVSALLVMIAWLAPGVPALTSEAELAHEQAQASSAWHEASFGFDASLPRAYWLWVQRVTDASGGVMLPLGRSMVSGRSAREEIMQRMPTSLLLGGMALGLAIAVAFPAGMISAVKAGRRADRLLSGALLALWSVPLVLLATLGLAFLAQGGLGLSWFPSAPLESDAHEPWLWRVAIELWSLALPAMTLALVMCAPLARHVRAAMVEQIGREFVQTALSKGVSRSRLLLHHVLRPGLGSVISVLGVLAPRALAGSVIVETVFSVDGLGRLAWRSALQRDLDVVIALALLAGVVHMLALIICDAAYVMVDPRVHGEGPSPGKSIT